MLLSYLLLISYCHLKRKELNSLRMNAEELENIFPFFADPANQYYNRSSTLISEMVEILYDCTLHDD